MKKARDTRNMLDSNRGIKKQGQQKTKRRERKLTMIDLKEEVKHFNTGLQENPRVIALRTKKKLTPGQLFKQQHGYSRTMAKLMKKYGCETVEGYRLIRRENKLAAKKARSRIEPAKVEIKSTSKSKPTKNKK